MISSLDSAGGYEQAKADLIFNYHLKDDTRLGEVIDGYKWGSKVNFSLIIQYFCLLKPFCFAYSPHHFVYF